MDNDDSMDSLEKYSLFAENADEDEMINNFNLEKPQDKLYLI